jgi:hypothetical protein
MKDGTNPAWEPTLQQGRSVIRTLIGILAAALSVSFSPRALANGQRFDGDWQTTVSCASARDALGYSFRFISTVKGGVLHGLHGTQGDASSLQIDGRIGDDGVANLYAVGHTGSKEFVPGRDTPRGTEYSYSIDAHFNASAGTGTRIEGRPCTYSFEKQ